MKTMNLLKNLGKKGSKEPSGSLTGRTLKIGSFQVKVEAVLGEGGFATIYRVMDVTTRAAMALKHFKLR
jgi:AP2-associated kinase